MKINMSNKLGNVLLILMLLLLKRKELIIEYFSGGNI